MARSDRKRVVWPAKTHDRKDRPEDLLTAIEKKKPWRPARDIIDWSIKGRSIFDRPKPLAPKTLARIHAGAVKFKWPEPYLVILRNHMAAQGIDLPLPTIAANGMHIGVVEPILLAPGSYGGARLPSDPLPTITTGGAGHEDRPGCARPMLVEPFVMSTAHGVGSDEIDPHSRRVRSADDPIGTVHAGGGNFAIVEPFVFSRQGEGAPRSVDEPTPTQVAKHSHVLISPYYGTGSGETCNSTEEPLPTITSKGRFGMVVPVTHSKGGNGARDVADPIPTLTTAKGGEFAIVMPVTHADGSARMRDAGIDPLPTVTGANRGELAVVNIACDAGEVRLDLRYDILFRMLEPHELAAAMGLEHYDFAGNKTEKIKQIGNAVSRRKMQACVGSIMADAAPPARLPAEEYREAAE